MTLCLPNQILIAKAKLREALNKLETYDAQTLPLDKQQLTLEQSKSLRSCAHALLLLVEGIPDQPNNPNLRIDATTMLMTVQTEISNLHDTISKCPSDLVDATTSLIKIVERLVGGTLMSGASFHNHTLLMQGEPESVDVHQLISKFKPFLELSMELAGSSPSAAMHQEIKAIKASNDNIIKHTDLMTAQLKEQNVLLKAQLEESKAQAAKEKLELQEKITCAEYRNLIYDVVANAERIFADENDAYAQSLFEGYRNGVYTPEAVEKAFDLQSDERHSEVRALTWSIRDIKEQRLSSGHSSSQLQKSTKISELQKIVEKYFSLTHRQLGLYEKIIHYSTRKYTEQNGEMPVDDLTVAEIMKLVE